METLAMNRFISSIAVLGLAAGLAGSLAPQLANASDDDGGEARVIYTETNAASGNEILVFTRSDGRFVQSAHVATHGTGTGGGLGNQGALALSENGRRLYAINAGSNDISVFAARGGALAFLQRIPSGGTQPVSLAVHGNLLYALNAGDAGNISGFSIADDGRLQAIAGSTRPLSAAAVGPAQISFNNSGDALVVTEKASNKISVYAVRGSGVAAGPFVRASSGKTPFGFSFDRRDHLIVSEAFGGAAGASALSSYDLDAAQEPLELVSGSVRTGQTAACWVVVTGNGRYAYTSNTGSGSISGYRVARNGALSLLTAGGITGNVGAGAGTTDLALARGSGSLLALNPPIGTMQIFAVRSDGSLVRGETILGVPGSATGLIAR
jgi:6-phosphogluconolactonase (cycloisomerase 2 family)